jgi:hypothetical protein
VAQGRQSATALKQRIFQYIEEGGVRFIKRLEKVESKLAHRHRETRERQHSSRLDQLAPEIWKIKTKAERDGDGRLALSCVRELERVETLLAQRNRRMPARSGLNLELDKGTAALMAQTFLQRQGVSPNQMPDLTRAESVPEEGKERQSSPAEQSCAQASQQGDDGPSIPLTRNQSAGCQLPPTWINSKW